MNPHFSAITLGVDDVDRAKLFYEGMGWPVEQDQGGWVSFRPAKGSAAIGLLSREALAADAGVDPAGSSFHGFAFSYIVRSEERVDAVLAEAEAAGGTIVTPGEKAQWGGYGGHFADPDGYLWKVVASSDPQSPFSE